MKPVVISVTSAWAKAHFSDITNTVGSYGKVAIITKFDKPSVAIVPLTLLPKEILEQLNNQDK
jgi:hypothetical protein